MKHQGTRPCRALGVAVRARVRTVLHMAAMLAVVAVAVCAFALPRTARAEVVECEVEVDGITYSVGIDTEVHTASLWSFSEPDASRELVVPGTFDIDGETYTLTSMSLSMSERHPNITKLDLPDTLTSITGRFSAFTSLTELTIPGSVKVFGASCQGMRQLQTLTFEEGVEEISAEAGMVVANCNELTAINLPSTLKLVNANASFSSAPKLASINLPEGIQFGENTLGHFSDCTSLMSVTLPASMTEIPYGMFSGCTALTTVEALSPIISVGPSAFSGCTALIDIPSLSAVTTIGSYAFNECGALTGPVDLSNVTSMGDRAFYNCQELTGELDLSGLTEIPGYAFAYVGKAKVTALNPELTSIGNWGFVWVDLSEVTFPDTLESIGNYGCYAGNLPDPVVIPDAVTELGTGVFASTDVTEFQIGSGLEAVDASVFPDTVQKIVFDNSQDNVTLSNAGNLPADVEIVYTLPSLTAEGDTIAADGPTLQEAVNEAEPGDVIELEKSIELDETLVIPAGADVTIRAVGADRYLYVMPGSDVADLVQVVEGGSVTFAGQDSTDLVIFGKNNSGSAVSSEGTVTLAEGSLVTRANFDDQSSGVIEVRGASASLTISGGAVRENKLVNDVAYAAPVYAADGAHVAILDGAISDNDATDGAALSSSAGVFLTSGATGELSGGTISDNTGHRGAAVMLFSDEAGGDARATFTQSGGEITGNAGKAALGVEASGAVHVESNAAYHLTGGVIANNTAGGTGSGGGVCVVDGNLQRGDEEYGTAFVMDGGTVSGNTASYGGGIYSYTNGVELNAGEISGNTAYSTGGGVYSEGNPEYYGTIQVSNALVTGNDAMQGGGLYFCATGSGVVRVTDGMAVFGNTATDRSWSAAAGDDVVFTKNAGDEYLLDLSERALGGGAVHWMRDGGVALMSSGLSVHPMTIDTPRYDADDEASMVQIMGDDLHAGQKDSLAMKALVSEDARALAEEHAELVISGNTAERGGGIGSNGGVIAGEDGVVSVVVQKVWNDEGTEDAHPASVTVHLYNGSYEIDMLVLSAENGWRGSFEGLPADGEYTVREDAVEGYTSEVTGSAEEGFTITNTAEPGEPTGPGGSEDPSEPEKPVQPDDEGTPEQPGGEELTSTGDATMFVVALCALAGAFLCGIAATRACRLRS